LRAFCVISSLLPSLMDGLRVSKATVGPTLRIPAASMRKASAVEVLDVPSDDKSTSSSDNSSDDDSDNTSGDECMHDLADNTPILITPPTTVSKKRKRKGHDGIMSHNYMHTCLP
jgi:hypothetical protein